MSEEPDTRSGLEEALRAPVRAVLDRPSRALTSAVADRVAEILIEEGVVERAVERAIDDPGTERAAMAVMDSELLDEIVDRVIASDELQKLVEHIAASPAVRAAIAHQGVGMLDDLRRKLGRLARGGDAVAERPVRALFRRGRREGSTPFGGGVVRVLAAAVDLAIVDLFLLSISALLALLVSSLTSGDPSTAGVVAAGATAWLTVGGFYLFAFWTLVGQTPGMRFIGIEVRRSDGSDLGARHAFRRLLGMGLCLLTLGIGFLLTLLTQRRRGLQDMIGDTVVLYTEETAPELPPAS